jgi:hypothetical protein
MNLEYRHKKFAPLAQAKSKLGKSEIALRDSEKKIPFFV